MLHPYALKPCYGVCGLSKLFYHESIQEFPFMQQNVPLSELVTGQMGDFFALLVNRTRGVSRDGKPYFSCRFRDARRTVAFMVWQDGPWFQTCEQDWQEGQFFKLRARYDEHRTYGPQIEVYGLRPAVKEDRAAGFNPLDFVDKSRFDVDVMFAELCKIADAGINDAPLRRLVLTLLERHSEALKVLPATLKRFYPFAGGLLEHTLSVTRVCLQLVEKYQSMYAELKPPLNRDLVVAGAILHDIGRVLEYEADPLNVRPTVPGQMFGHLFLGRDLVRDTARELGEVHLDLLQMLEHIIITHLNLPEWGSPKLPLIPECLIIHHADDLDAKMEMYARCLLKDTEAGPFTARDASLGRNLYKGRSL